MADFAPSSCAAADAPAEPFKTVALVGKYQAAGIATALRDIAQCIVAGGYRLVFERETALNVGIDEYPLCTPAEIAQVADVAVVLGGDGTMLGISRELAAPEGGRTVPLIGVNLGRLGFMTDIRLEDLRTVLPDMLAGRHTRETRTMLEAQTRRDGVVIDAGLALNDVVMTRAGMTGMLELAVTVGGEFMYNQRSDGLIVSTPTGSTAYALAAGGPILHPALAGIVLVPIAPHALSNRPIVLPHDSEVEIEVVAGKSVSVHFDMQELNALLQGDRIVIRRSKHTVCFLHPRGHNHFATLRNKLHWHEQ